MTVDRDEVAALTEQYGGRWGIMHTRRLLHLVPALADGALYDEEIVWLAAHLHDWGGYAPWARTGVDHSIRSTEVAGPFLCERGVEPERVRRVQECIEFHHGGPDDRGFESVLLTDADALDLLGTVGALRIFAMHPRDLDAGAAGVRAYREKCAAIIRTSAGRRMCAERAAETDRVLAAFEAETFGLY